MSCSLPGLRPSRFSLGWECETMNPRLYERMYGLRYLFVVGAVVLFAACVSAAYFGLASSGPPRPAVATSVAPIAVVTTPVPASPSPASGPIGGPAATSVIPGPATAVKSQEPTARPLQVTPAAPLPTPTQVVAAPPTPTALPPTPVLPAPTAVAPKPAATPNPIFGDGTYVVQPGDSLWSIATDQCRSGFRWPEIFQSNHEKILNPDLIFVGWTLKTPCLR